MSRAALFAFAFLFSLSSAVSAQVQPRRPAAEPPRAVLWVGNSFFYYNNSMHSHVLAFVRAADPQSRARAVSVTISGSGIDWHDLESYFRPDGIGKYSFVGDNELAFNDEAARRFDAVIVMDCSQCPIHPKLRSVFHEYAKKQSEIARRHGARTILFMSWAYKDRPRMTAQLAEQYTIAGNANDALVVPAGLAFAKAVAKRPELELYQADRRHPSLAGTYLAAATVYAAVYRGSPVGSAYTAGLDRNTAGFLQSVAGETVEEYFGK
jgi:hypothetical protein